MEFGQADDLEGLDLSLPPDHPQTTGILLDHKPGGKRPDILVGCAKWGRKPWVGKFYPKGTKEKDFLKYYAKQFDSIELNATFYKFPTEDQIRSWKEQTGSDFSFCPKFPQYITHIRRLKDAERQTADFIESIQLFGKQLGPSFIQLPPNYGPKNYAVLENFLRQLPQGVDFRLELRHPDWFKADPVTDEIFSLLQELNIGTVLSDAAGRRDAVHMRLTTPKAFIRFVGNQLHPTDYTRMDEWVERIEAWLKDGLQELDFFMHQHEELDSPILCQYFIAKLNERCGLHVKLPHILD